VASAADRALPLRRTVVPVMVAAQPSVAVAATVPAPSQDVFTFLADLENHWLVADRFVEVITLDGPLGARTGGMVSVRGPLGLRRTAKTQVGSVTGPRRMAGTAEIGARTRATIRWTLEERSARTAVTLEATVETASLLDRFLLAAGGRWWLRRRFERTLNRLAAHFAATAASRQHVEISYLQRRHDD